MVKKQRTRIERHLPPAGTILEGQFNKKQYKAKIVESPNLPEGKAVNFENVLYRSMTAAAKAATKQSTNGWRFWKIAGQP